ncbi:MAG: DUF1559 domain-containing protein, partial [Planctomycetaceae bacterium]|nr:DUF1559 domain-containing protein [Planctomycetaceae bacterium]
NGEGSGVNNADDTATAGGIAVVPYTCLQQIDPASGGSKKKYVGTAATNHFGTRWADGRGPSNFATILPPNSASCISHTTYDYGRRQMSAASSMHTGGINAALGDGSVQFISDTINAVTTGTLDATVHPVSSGISPFGVWGAYGSMNGGESSSL